MLRSSADSTITLQPGSTRLRQDISRLLKKRWVYHGLFWIVYYLFIYVMVIFGIFQIFDPVFYVQLTLFFVLDIAMAYFNLYVLIPRLLLTGKYFYYAISLISVILFIATLIILLKQVYAHFGAQIFSITAAFTFANVSAAIMERFYLLGLTTAIKLAKAWAQSQQRIREKEKQFLETELNFLKSQIQPHFFFNTLNNLYSLTLKKSDKAPDVVLKLSELMSYMLYESNTPRVPLNKEIAYLRNYLDLEALRFGQRLAISFNIEGTTDQVYIPPLILILFIENSFKHGVKNILHNIEIDIRLKVEKSCIFFQVKNPVDPGTLTTETSGIGLKNVRRRLDLLFGKEYELEGLKTDNEYVVSLKIPI